MTRLLLAVVVYVCLVAPSEAAIAEVGAGSQRATANNATGTATTVDLAFPGNVTVGNLLIIAGSWYDDSGNPATAATDTVGTNYIVLINEISAGEDHFIAYGIAAGSGANTVHVTGGLTTGYASFSIDEFSGVDTSTPLSVNGGSSTGTSTTPADALVTLTSGELVVGIVLWSFGGGTVSATPGSGYTQIGEQEDSANGQDLNAEFQIVTTATSYSVAWTLGGSRAWVATTASFKAAGGAPPPVGAHQSLLLGVH